MTEGFDPLQRLWIIGAGAVGVAMASLLRSVPRAGTLWVSGRRESPPAHEAFRVPPVVPYRQGITPPQPPPTSVLLAVPDRAIQEVASKLAESGLPPLPILHTSGALGREPLQALADSGWSTGSLHPLVAVAATKTGVSPLEGAWFALQADGPARQLGDEIVQIAGGSLLEIADDAKPVYHAAAVFASNYLVVLLAVAERLAASAGADPADAREAFTTLAAGALASVKDLGPEKALTGPIARGDVETVQAHLSRLSASDRPLYSRLARAALEMSETGLPADAVRSLKALLRRDE